MNLTKLYCVLSLLLTPTSATRHTMLVPVKKRTVSKQLIPSASKRSMRSVRSIIGIASFYGGKFHGRLTANGERFNRYAMTLASRTLPFNTRVCVTNLHTGKSVIGRVNDRGPFVRGRIVDLSEGMAHKIGFKDGLIKVKITVVSKPRAHR